MKSGWLYAYDPSASTPPVLGLSYPALPPFSMWIIPRGLSLFGLYLWELHLVHILLSAALCSQILIVSLFVPDCRISGLDKMLLSFGSTVLFPEETNPEIQWG